MKVGKRTAKLLREAIVLGYVEGAYASCGRTFDEMMKNYPKDSDVVRRVLRAARCNGDLYPTLSKVWEPGDA